MIATKTGNKQAFLILIEELIDINAQNVTLEKKVNFNFIRKMGILPCI